MLYDIGIGHFLFGFYAIGIFTIIFGLLLLWEIHRPLPSEQNCPKPTANSTAR